MEKFIGERVLGDNELPFGSFTQQDWALWWIAGYGSIDGDHHKVWLLDQLARILNGTKVIVTVKEWDNGDFQHRFSLAEPTQKYWDWVADVKNGEDGPDTYDYDFGIAP